MLGGGASLPQIAQVLRHASLETTAIYAKPRVLHQAGKKPQVSWSALVPNWFTSPMADAC
jgi:hypothetical protein